LVYNKLCKNKRLYDFKFWLNGVNKFNDLSFIEPEQSNPHYLNVKSGSKVLLYPGRFDEWKRQDLAIEIMHQLVLLNHDEFILVFCGHNYSNSYFSKLKRLVIKYNLDSYVYFIDPIAPAALHRLMNQSYAVLSLYKHSNLGNVLIEASLAGSFIITILDGSTDFLIENCITGVALPYNGDFEAEIAKVVIQYSNEEKKRVAIKHNLQRRADNLFLTWEERSNNEIKLIENSVKKGK